MTVRLIQWKARELQARTRKRWMATWTGPVLVLVLYALSLRMFRPLPTEIHFLFAVALAWSVAGLLVITRGIRAAAMPPDAGASTGLAFCREEIARRRLLEGRQLLWSFAPLLLSVFSVIAGLVSTAGARETRAKGLPFLLLVAAWIVSYGVLRYRDRHALEGELAELDAIENDR